MTLTCRSVWMRHQGISNAHLISIAHSTNYRVDCNERSCGKISRCETGEHVKHPPPLLTVNNSYVSTQHVELTLHEILPMTA